MQTIRPEVLIISNKHDYSTDHVTFQLNNVGAAYLRLNRDQFADYEITLAPTGQRLHGQTPEFSFEVTAEGLRSIFFRAPVYLRDNYQPDLSPNEQLSRSQWAAFIRSLVVFDDVLWVNHPQATYQAEIKPYQLYVAKKIGFDVPETIVANTASSQNIIKTEKLIIKTLDPVILTIDDQEAFIYTNVVDCKELLTGDLSSAPVILQEPLLPKVDLRITVVGNEVFAVDIKQHGKGVTDDWRLKKNNVQYSIVNLPHDVEDRCVALVKHLGLNFGAIDLAIHEGKYYFLEINPTGEWAWLVDHTNLEIDLAIVHLLLGSKGHVA